MSPCNTCYEFNPQKIPDSASGRPIDPIRLSTDRKSFKAKWPFATWNRQRQNGCPLCALICNGVEKFHSPKDLIVPQKYWLEAIIRIDDPLEVEVSELIDSKASADTFGVRTKLEFHVDGGDSIFLAAIATAPVVHPRAENFSNTIMSWTQDCLDNHPLCLSKHDTRLPGRVIDVGDSSDSTRLRLHRIDGLIGDYVALSHCWGTKPIIRTTTSNLASFEENIPWLDLSKTFQDAVTITRQLGLQFLWIDSLCIVQDDDNDWEKEASKMGSIYGNAHLTIAATRAKSGEVGCFSERPTSYQVPWTGAKRGSTQPAVFVRKFLFHDIFHDESSSWGTQASSEDYPLFDRAWCYQERLLAPRIVHYTPYEMVWECRSNVRCECNGIRRSGRGASIDARPSQVLTQSGNRFESHDPEGGFKLLFEETLGKTEKRGVIWRSLVHFYTSRKLTFQRDKLPALSGIASRLSDPGLGEYIAGLWEHDVGMGLLWHTGLGRAHRPKSYTGPSFSWVSVDGEVSWTFSPKDYRTQHFLIVETATTRRGEDRFGAVSAGHLRIRGFLAAAKCRTEIHAQAEGSHIPPCVQARLQKGELEVSFDIDTFDDARDEWNENVYCLLLFSVRDHDEDSGGHEATEALVLIPTNDENTYSRIGLAGLNKAEMMWWVDAEEDEVIVI